MFCVHCRYLEVRTAKQKTRYSPAIDAHILCFSPLHVPQGDPLQATSAIQHFHDKLLHIKDRLKTEPGKRMGQKRHEFVSVPDNFSRWGFSLHLCLPQMLQFLGAVEEEYEGGQ